MSRSRFFYFMDVKKCTALKSRVEFLICAAAFIHILQTNLTTYGVARTAQHARRGTYGTAQHVRRGTYGTARVHALENERIGSMGENRRQSKEGEEDHSPARGPSRLHAAA